MILDTVKRFISQASGYPCYFEKEEVNNTECVVYLDSIVNIDQDNFNNQKIFRVSGAIFVINAYDRCSFNELKLIEISEKIQAQFESVVNVERESSYIKYSIAFKDIQVFESPLYVDGIIKEVRYLINGKEY